MARLEGTPTTGGKQVTTVPIEQLAMVLLPQGYTELSITVGEGEQVADIVAVLGFVYPGQALDMSADGQTVSFAPPVEIKPKASKTTKGKTTNGTTDDGTTVQ